LNCIEDLAPVAALARKRLLPGGWMMIGLLARTCAWEIAHGLVHLGPREAFGRLRAHQTVAIDGIDVPAYYHRLRDVRAAFGPSFVVSAVLGLGVFVPPASRERWWQHVPAPVRRTARWMEDALGARFPFNRLGDYFFVELHRDAQWSGAPWT
jgi:hypothetical protein